MLAAGFQGGVISQVDVLRGAVAAKGVERARSHEAYLMDTSLNRFDVHWY
jgi:hypothetical protein